MSRSVLSSNEHFTEMESPLPTPSSHKPPEIHSRSTVRFTDAAMRETPHYGEPWGWCLSERAVG